MVEPICGSSAGVQQKPKQMLDHSIEASTHSVHATRMQDDTNANAAAQASAVRPSQHTLSPSAAMAFAGGPRNLMPLAASASGSSGFSEAWPLQKQAATTHTLFLHLLNLTCTQCWLAPAIESPTCKPAGLLAGVLSMTAMRHGGCQQASKPLPCCLTILATLHPHQRALQPAR